MIYFREDHTGHRVDNGLKGTEGQDIMTSYEAAVILVRNDTGLEQIVHLGKKQADRRGTEEAELTQCYM